jgi:hypothetical protein
MRTRDVLRSTSWSRFLDALAAALGSPAVVLRPKYLVAWRDGKWLNHLELVRWSCPDALSPDAPYVTRLSMNYYYFGPSKALLRKLGFPPQARPSRREELRLEWSVLDEQMLEFAAWIPLWMRGRLDPSAAIPLPPHPSHVFGEGLRTTMYGWTATAWSANALANGQSVDLPRYAIPAARVVPAEAERRP